MSITGTNFTGTTAVKFGGTSATTFSVVSATSITATVPAGATTGTVSVTTPSGTGTSSASFTVTNLAIDCGSTSGVTSGGLVWEPDNGSPALTTARMLTTTVTTFANLPSGVPYQLFQSQRQSDGSGFSFTEGSVANGNYTLTLYFAEIQSGVTAGQRIFNVLVNGQTVLSHFDITQQALDNGAMMNSTLNDVVTESVPVTVTGGTLTVSCSDVTGYALLAAFALTPPPGPAPDVPPPGWAEGSVPTDDGTDADGDGPASSLGVSLPSQVEEVMPGADLSSYNPLGPSVAYTRSFRGNLAKSGYASPGLSPGWTDGYDLFIEPVAGGYTLIYPNGATDAWTGGSGSLTVPSGASYLAYQASGPPNTIKMEFKDRTVYTFAQVTAASANGQYPANTYLLSKITNLVGRAVTFNRDSAANDYRVMTITNDASTPVTLLGFTYTGTGGSARLSKVQDLASPTAAENREVEYNFSGTSSLLTDVTTVQSVGTAFATGNDQWQYTYQSIASVAYISTVAAPDPMTPGTLTNPPATVTLGTSGPTTGLVTAITDANGHYRSYLPTVSATQVAVFNSASDPMSLEKWTASYAAGGTNAGTGGTDGAGNITRVDYQNVPQGDTPSPSGYLPSVGIDRNGHATSLTYALQSGASNTYGNVATTLDSRGVTVSMMYGYPAQSQFPVAFGLGQTSSVQEANPMLSLSKQATTFDYFMPSDGVIDGLLKDVKSPTPDTVNGTATVKTSYFYTGTSSASLGNVMTVIDPGNETGTITTTYSYTMDSSYNATGGAGSFSQNEAVGEPLTVQDGLLHTTHFRYDGRGNRTYVIDAYSPGNVTQYVYNLANQLAMVIYPAVVAGDTMGAYEIYTYQYVGGPLKEADLYSEGTPMGGAAYRTTTYTYDHEGQTLSETDLKGLLGTWTYDARGRVNLSGDGKNNYTHYAYTQAGSLYQELYPGASISQNPAYDNQYTATPGTLDTLSYAYDPDQNVTQTQDGRGVVATYQRMDPESLVTETDYSNLPASVTVINPVDYAYDGYGRRMSMDDETGTGQSGSNKVYTYDDLDELETATTSFLGGPQSQILSYTHNNDGSRSAMLTPTSVHVSDPLLAAGYVYAHDGAHRLTAVTFPWYKSSRNSGPAEKNTLVYYDNNWLSTSFNSRLSATYAYDQRGFVKSLANSSTAVGGTAASFSSITYDAAGNRTGFNATLPAIKNGGPVSSHALSYSYDGRDELTEEKSVSYGGNTNSLDLYDQTFGYDLAYNRTAFMDVTPLGNSSFSYMFGVDNQNNGSGFLYDGSGNPTQYNGSAAANLTYDPEQRLTGIADKSFTAHYDGDGMRDYTIYGSTTTYYLYDGASPVLEETYSGTTTTIAVANGYADGWRERAGGGGFNAYVFDPQGSLAAEDVNSNTQYAAANVYAYDGYGTRLFGERVSNGSLTAFNVDPVQFGGQYGYYTDVPTTEVQLTHRYYDPSTGHFLNRDPIGYNGGQNLYAFCGNNPITGSDDSGLNPTMDKEDSDAIERAVLDGTDRAKATRTVMGNRARSQAQRYKEDMEVVGDGATAIGLLSGIGESVILTRAVLAGVAERVAARTAAKIAAEAAAKEAAVTAAKEAARPFAELTSQQINQEVIGAVQRDLVTEWFGTGARGATSRLEEANFYVPKVTREALEGYKEIITRNLAARQAMGRVIGADDVGMLRMQLIEKALSQMTK